jgi:HEAT repeat protein
MAWQGVEIEIQVPCAEGQTHPVRLRFTGWGEFEVAYNPCEELLGPVFARMAACTHYLYEQFPEAFRRDTALKRRLVEAFGAAGAPAVPALIQALGDSGWNVRRAAAEALGKLGDPQAVPALIQALGDSDSAVRAVSAEALGAIGDPQAVPALIVALGDWGDWWSENVRRAAAEALVRIGAPAVPALIQALGDRSENVRRAAAEALVRIGAPAVPALIQALGDDEFRVRRAAAEALVRIGAPAVPALIQALGDRSENVRRAAAEALGAIGDPQAIPALIQALGDSDSAVRAVSAEALGAIGDPQAVPPLIQALGDSDWDVRRAAAEALGRLGNPQAVPPLSVWAHAGEDAARNALQTLGYPMLDLPQAVAQVAAQGAWGVLIRALTCTQVREVVVGLGAPAVPALVQALGDSDSAVRAVSAEALGAIGDPQAVPALIQALGDYGYYVRRAAQQAIQQIETKQSQTKRP